MKLVGSSVALRYGGVYLGVCLHSEEGVWTRDLSGNDRQTNRDPFEQNEKLKGSFFPSLKLFCHDTTIISGANDLILRVRKMEATGSKAY